jgi:hypothetical protein
MYRVEAVETTVSAAHRRGRRDEHGAVSLCNEACVLLEEHMLVHMEDWFLKRAPLFLKARGVRSDPTLGPIPVRER